MSIKATYVDHMGSDLSVVNAARVSFGKKSEWERVTLQDRDGPYLLKVQLKKEDAKLIKYLADHKHYSPFGHCFASFHIKAPIFVARQLVKHEYLRMNEISRRYVDSEPEFYVPDVWRGRAKDKKQGSDGVFGTDMLVGSSDYNKSCKDFYQDLIDSDIAPEMARMVLPQSMYTEWYWSGSMDAFANMCNLRLKEDTQYETRLVAQQIDKVMGELYPVSWTALVGEETK
ncbi:THY1 Predicted alternative thymidylate synthase [uncultured Caudovirales phage]|uniref:THY1 Predicted alternative thymidylate synthase n=1 Tax=uncultured Caudovirales phage TaxID=2100421 RepID=A0A6J5LZ58_9CAUD|nr:THY1 Predicted alternative thymidylate synthase [uncultured Caudovirales phage]